MLERDSLRLLDEALNTLERGFADLPAFTPRIDLEALRPVLQATAERLQDNYPYPHPLYAGQMLKPPHPMARLAYMLALWINPNNHALDGGRASSAMEKEAVAELARMFGFDAHLGHLTSGGTMANLEALWIASQECPGVVLASEQAHYTHSRISGVLKLPFESIPADAAGRMDLDALEARLQRGKVGTVVATLGSTALGAVDPLHEILPLARRYGARVHVDAAYGGYFRLSSALEPAARAAFAATAEADSLVVDPHKHGLQPYGCGCVLFRDPAVGRHYRHDSPYTYFTSSELHLGEISLECSRAGASAVALWATQRLLPLEAGGEFAQGLNASLSAAQDLHRRLSESPAFCTGPTPELDIVVWAMPAERASAAGQRARQVFETAAETQHLHLALTRMAPALWSGRFSGPDFWDADTLTCLRSCLMKPEHADWLDELWERLCAAAA